MSQGWENHESAPIEFLHGRLLELFHEYRKKTVGEKVYEVPLSGNEFNNIFAQAKRETYAKYPKQVSSKPILKTDL